MHPAVGGASAEHVILGGIRKQDTQSSKQHFSASFAPGSCLEFLPSFPFTVYGNL